jgi:organic hydroperoxide reductase OsmC/OhrA
VHRDPPRPTADHSTAPVHSYRATCTWSGSTAAGYDAYDRTHDGATPPVEGTLALSADPAFRGDPALANPEQLVVLAASSCQLLSFLAVAARARLDVRAYHDDARGEMPEGDRPVRITRIVLRPRITLGPGSDPGRVPRLVEVAHRECFIANSLRSDVVVEPVVVVLDEADTDLRSGVDRPLAGGGRP